MEDITPTARAVPADQVYVPTKEEVMQADLQWHLSEVRQCQDHMLRMRQQEDFYRLAARLARADLKYQRLMVQQAQLKIRVHFARLHLEELAQQVADHPGSNTP